MLVDYGLDVQYHLSNGYLVIMDSVQGYLTGDTYGLFKLIQRLARRVQKHAKSGIFSISDMG
jgi:hypothetical protein